MNILEDILEAKRAEVAGLDAVAIHRRLAHATPPRGFAAALRESPPPAVIAEFKRASPSKGDIRSGADAAEITADYEAAGAAALSVLTDSRFFSGSLADLEAARAATAIPVLRKDFIIDPLQVAEARATGADAVLLIAAALTDSELAELLEITRLHGMDALVEVHDEPEAKLALEAGVDLIGVNNRDLHSFITDTAVTTRLLPSLAGATVVSESGIEDPAVIAELSAAGADAFLVGEALMRASDPGRELKRLRGRG